MKDILKLLQKMGALGLETKANEVMHTGNSAAGAEFIPLEEFKQGIIDIVPQRSTFLQLLPGNHGSNLPKKYTSAVLGLSAGDLLFEKKAEWTTGTAGQTEDDHSQQKVATKQVSIEQASFIAEVDISDNQLRYNAANTEEYVKQALAAGMAFTVESVIINGDSETGATGNVNLDDAAPNAKKYYLALDHGVRERAINGSYTRNVGTLALDDYAALQAIHGQYATNPDDLLFVQSIHVTQKTKLISELLTKDKAGENATVIKGLMPTVLGTSILTHRAVPKTEADGKVSTTAGNNTLGQIVSVYKPAVQYGFGQDFTLEVVRVPGYGWRLVATFDFGFMIIDSEASLTDPTVAAGINVTIA